VRENGRYPKLEEVVVQECHPNTLEVEAGKWWVPGLSGLHYQILSQNKQTKYRKL
jgi:hypothetical protein